MYLGGFYSFAKFWQISSKIDRFLAEKPIFSAKNKKSTFDEISIFFFNIGPIGPIFGINVPCDS